MQGENVLQKGKYHASCYGKLMRKYKDSLMHDTNNEVSDQSNKGLYDKAFQTLCEEINEDLFHEGKLLLLTSLSERYHDILKSIDSSISSLYTTHRLKDKLQQLYGDRIKIEKDSSQKLIIFSSKITEWCVFRSLQCITRIHSKVV